MKLVFPLSCRGLFKAIKYRYLATEATTSIFHHPLIKASESKVPTVNLTLSSSVERTSPLIYTKPGIKKPPFPRVIAEPRTPINTVALFLKAVGRGCDAHVGKFPDWDSLFKFDSKQLKSIGITARERKWILSWVHKYTLGIDPYYIPPGPKSLKKKWKLSDG